MKIWIVWLPNVWKSTLFNALTKSYAADAANFPFCTIEPNIWIVDVKDPRIDKLSEISNTQNKIYANIKFVDIAWLVKGASKWEWLWNKFLSNIREVDAIVQVVRYFQDSEVVHVEWSVNPLRDIEIINTELIMSDLEQIEEKLPALEKRAKWWKDKDAEKLAPILAKAKEALINWKLVWDIVDELTDEEQKLIKNYNLLTFKPFIYAVNVSDNDLWNAENIKNEFEQKLNKPVTIVCAKIEAEMIEMSNEEKQEFLNEMAGTQWRHIPTLDDLIKLWFDTVGLMYYFTTWEKETRAWTVKKWSTAPQAAWAIHTDFEKWFIKAEVVNYEKFVQAWSWSKAKENWFVKLEWKEYIVQDWDIIIFKFNV